MKISRLSGLLVTLFLVVMPSLASAAPEQWAKEIDQLTAADAANEPPKDGIVFVGSSSIRLWTSLKEDFPGLPVLNRGFGGSQLADSVHYVDRLVIANHPRIVVLYAGDNDIFGGKSPEAVAADFKAFRTKIHAALPETKILYLSIKASPSRARVHEQFATANRLIAADCASHPHCAYVDVATPMLDAAGKARPELYRDDLLHMKPAGYAIWATAVRPYLKP